MELLKKLTHITAVSGNEESIFSHIVSELGDYADEIYTDSLNNIIVHKNLGMFISVTARCEFSRIKRIKHSR